MNKALLHKEVQEFISEHYNSDISKLIFQGSPFRELPVQELAIQLSGKQKAEKKLPTWFRLQGIIYPPGMNLEQTSSEITAAYKASIPKGDSIADLTGGFGVDSYFFSRNFKKVIHCEQDPSLSRLVAHNADLLGAGNITCIAGDGIKFLEEAQQGFDWIYLDPSRRTGSGGRAFHLSDCSPDVPQLQDLLYSHVSNILVKTSPFLDLQAGISSLQGVREIHIVAVKNEVKELLWVMKKGFAGKVRVKTINFTRTGEQVYSNQYGYQPGICLGPPRTYLYEPNAALMKSGMMEALGHDLELEKLHPNSHLFTSDQLKEFPGRVFEILRVLPANRKKVKRELDLEKANITTRNFPESVASLRKQYKIREGGEHYLFFTTCGKDEKLVLICKKAGQDSSFTTPGS